MHVFFVCLYDELVLYVPVNSNGHVGTLSPFYGTFTHDTQNVLHEYNHPSKPIRLIFILFIYTIFYEGDALSFINYSTVADLSKTYIHVYTLWKGTSRQRSGKGAIRKRFPLQKPRWEMLINVSKEMFCRYCSTKIICM